MTLYSHVVTHDTGFAPNPFFGYCTFTSEILAVNDRRVEFKVTARTEEELIGEGTHERAIINVAKFATRLAEKTQRK